MYLVLCATDDFPALWAARGLRERGLLPLEIVSDKELAFNRGLVHTIIDAQPGIEIALADGRVIEGAAVRGTLNRLQTVPADHIMAAGPKDQQYAQQELFALFLSWLHGMPGSVVNRPTPQGLSGSWRHWSEWCWMAGNSGLATKHYGQDGNGESYRGSAQILTTQTLIVLDNAVFGPSPPAPVAEGCVRLAELSETRLLGVTFEITRDHLWLVSAITPLPDLRTGGVELLDALASALQK